MDVLIEWKNVPWDEPEDEQRPGVRTKTCMREGQQVDLFEFTEEFARDGWCTEGHLIHVVEGESSMRFKDGRVVRLRPGDTGIILAGEGDAHRMELAAGEHIVILGFEQP